MSNDALKHKCGGIMVPLEMPNDGYLHSFRCSKCSREYNWIGKKSQITLGLLENEMAESKESKDSLGRKIIVDENGKQIKTMPCGCRKAGGWNFCPYCGVRMNKCLKCDDEVDSNAPYFLCTIHQKELDGIIDGFFGKPPNEPPKHVYSAPDNLFQPQRSKNEST